MARCGVQALTLSAPTRYPGPDTECLMRCPGSDDEPSDMVSRLWNYLPCCSIQALTLCAPMRFPSSDTVYRLWYWVGWCDIKTRHCVPWYGVQALTLSALMWCPGFDYLSWCGVQDLTLCDVMRCPGSDTECLDLTQCTGCDTLWVEAVSKLDTVCFNAASSPGHWVACCARLNGRRHGH